MRMALFMLCMVCVICGGKNGDHQPGCDYSGGRTYMKAGKSYGKDVKRYANTRERGYSGR